MSIVWEPKSKVFGIKSGGVTIVSPQFENTHDLIRAAQRATDRLRGKNLSAPAYKFKKDEGWRFDVNIGKHNFVSAAFPSKADARSAHDLFVSNLGQPVASTPQTSQSVAA